MGSMLRCEIYTSFGGKNEDEREVVNNISPVSDTQNLSGWEAKTGKAGSAAKATARVWKALEMRVRVQVPLGRWLPGPGALQRGVDVSSQQGRNRVRKLTHQGQSPEDNQRGGDNSKP